MGYPLRWNWTDLVYEVTIDTIQGRYLLRPSREVRDLILGVVGRAQERYDAIRLYAFVFTRNRATLLLSSGDEELLPKFMAYVAGEISRKLGRLLDWSGKLWASRYRALPILDEEAIIARLRFVLAQGVHEGLVASPRAWPGASCVPALLGPMNLEGAWVDRDREARLRGQGLDPPAAAYVHPYRVVLTPIPAWAELPRPELVARYQAIIEAIEREHLVTGAGPVLDPVELQRQDPFTRPASLPTRGLARFCHATYKAVVDAFGAAYQRFRAAFLAAARALAARPSATATLVAEFPAGCHPRPGLRVRRPQGTPPPWREEAPTTALARTMTPPATSPDETGVSAWTTDGHGEPETAPWYRAGEAEIDASRPPAPATSPGHPRRPGRKPAPAPVTRALAHADLRAARPPRPGRQPDTLVR